MPVVLWETDLWPDAFAATGRDLPGALERAIEGVNRAVHGRAEVTCLNSQGLLGRLVEKGIDPARLAVITDWADESLFHPVDLDRGLAERHGLEGRFNVVYGGNFGPAQDLGTVIDAASHLTDLEEVQIILIGGGEEEAALRARVAARGLANVRLVARQPMAEIHRFYALADVLLAHLRPEPLFELQIPSKIMAYLACCRPILCAIAGPAGEVVRDAEAGLVARPGDPQSIAGAIRELHRMPSAERQRLGANGRRAYLEKYTREVQSKRFEEILSRVAAAGKTV
jgi:glycosyltransferase involved in cell wall biosynthesis